MPSEVVTAAVLVIGDEILSGRTKDKNIGYIADYLTAIGIDLKEVRVVSDEEPAIVEALNALRARYTYVFTTGGIGPTHDDITADAVAKAFGVGIDFHPEAMALLKARFAGNPDELNEMRRRMARVPLGGSLIKNGVSATPGFRMENVFVMAGVPSIMQAMLEDIAPKLKRGRVVHALTIGARVAEGAIAGALARLQADHPSVAIGSYPFYRPDGFGVQLVVRGTDLELVEGAAAAIEQMLRHAGAEPERLSP
jgi:molybdenum cofactor synthesis domain-containing protein